MKTGIASRPKPRRVYVSEDEWRKLKAQCAKDGTNVSAWVRNAIKSIPTVSAFVFIVVVTVLGLCIYQKLTSINENITAFVDTYQLLPE